MAATSEKKPIDHVHAAAQAAARGETPPPAAEKTEPLLIIKTLKPDRATVEIDGEEFELRLYRDFGVAEQQELTQDGQEFDSLWRQRQLTPKERKRLKTLLDRMFDKVLDAPAPVKAKLNDEERQDVVTNFSLAPLRMAAREEEKRLASESTSDISSPDSSDFMELETP